MAASAAIYAAAAVFFILGSFAAPRLKAQDDAESPAPQQAVDAGEQFAKAAKWREIGPANMGGRITDLAIVPDRPQVW